MYKSICIFILYSYYITILQFFSTHRNNTYPIINTLVFAPEHTENILCDYHTFIEDISWCNTHG